MICSSELRIGNWVNWPYSGLVPPYYQIYNLPDVNDIYPINLTPEILEKCGFNKTNLGDHFIILPNGNYFEIIGSACFISEAYGDPIEIFKPLKYLHQLQNLYHSITGKELQITL